MNNFSSIELSNTLCCAAGKKGIFVNVRYTELTIIVVDGIYLEQQIISYLSVDKHIR